MRLLASRRPPAPRPFHGGGSPNRDSGMRDMGLQGVVRDKPAKTTVSDRSAPCPLDNVKRYSALAARSISAATSCECDIITTCDAPATSITSLPAARFAMKAWSSRGIFLSRDP